jgi:hypothetical protein
VSVTPDATTLQEQNPEKKKCPPAVRAAEGPTTPKESSHDNYCRNKEGTQLDS